MEEMGVKEVKMKLLKNKVGRPSNDTLQKRKLFYIVISVAVVILTAITGFTLYHYVRVINGTEKNASASTCVIPYSNSKCKYARNSTIKQVQKMLNKLGYYKKSYGYDGNFGPKTLDAVKKFQSDYGLDVDGYIGPGTLEELAKATNTNYFKVQYDKNGGSGTLNSQYGNIQTIIRGIATPMSSTKLTKGRENHVGYTGTTIINGTEYRYGCFTEKCVSGKQSRYSVNAIKNNEKKGKPFYDYIYPIGAKLKSTAKNGETVKMTAFYCAADEVLKDNTCKKASVPSSSGKYNITGSMTGYNGYCDGCSGITYCLGYDVRKNLKYTDKLYGPVRIVAMDLTYYPCGTIIEIEQFNEGTPQKAIKAIVLDKGSAITNNKIDLLSLDEEPDIYKKIGKQEVKFKILRKGF